MTVGTTSEARRIKAKPAHEPDKRERILVAAEKLFAQEGYHGVSMRDIAKSAEVGLPIIVYHFETKLNLYRSIFEFRREIMEERLNDLGKIDDFDSEDAVERIVRAFIAPIVRSHATPEGIYHAQLVVREASDPQEATRGIIEEYFDPLARAFIDALRKAIPTASHEYLCWAYLFSVGALVMSDFDGRMVRISQGKYAGIPMKKKIAMLSRYIAAGIRASS
ncbi:CerR family C-terminal domain-containing protein [Caballeronia sp. LP006]|uniref:TetR/AcrR family transcriptional regulator n=1 Tax=Caballeronia sp. LP006 TaxID=3038552 RepID=UPI002860A2BF|nr:TetR family transcriptional regulator [Caballeronia sp. LP006]MDR5826317.1 CerR family C-terminal domain-containing protein [Caballeronia sp. LP006]